jgi:hypothetical protein
VDGENQFQIFGRRAPQVLLAAPRVQRVTKLEQELAASAAHGLARVRVVRPELLDRVRLAEDEVRARRALRDERELAEGSARARLDERCVADERDTFETTFGAAAAVERPPVERAHDAVVAYEPDHADRVHRALGEEG